MGAVVKNPIPHLAQASVPGPPSVVALGESLVLVPITNVKQIRSLSGFLPVTVLIHESTIKNLDVACKVTLSTPRTETKFVRAIKRFKTTVVDGVFVFGDVTVNLSSMEACRQGEPVVLTAMEFRTLKYLIQNARRVISRDELLNEVWGYETYPCTRTVDNHILRLRRKLEREPSRPVHFLTVHGSGYKFLP
jgi:DNA-binding response OmpR family regulator